VPLLGAATQGETLVLSPSGAWTAVHAATLESLINFASSKVQQAQSLKIDMQQDPAFLRPHFLEIPLSGSHEQGDVSP